MIHEFEGKKPKVAASCFIAKSADVIGNVEIGNDSSVWFNAVVRGDINTIKIGKRVSVQDNSVLHVDPVNSLEIGDDIVIGHNAILHGCKIGKNSLIGMGAVVLSGAEIGEGCVVGAGAVVIEDMKVENWSKVLGIPAKVTGGVSEERLAKIRENSQAYVALKEKYKK